MQRPTGTRNAGNLALLPLVCALGLMGVFHTAAAHAQSAADREIRALEDRFVAAENAQDLDAVMSGYVHSSELFVFDLGLPRQHSGWEAYRKDWQDFFAVARNPKLDIQDLSVTVDGHVAYSHMIQHVIWTNQDGSRTELKASVTDVYRRIDGKWLIVQEHLSVPIRLGTGKAEMMSQP